MNTFFQYLIGKVLKYLANSSTEELTTVLKLVITASTKFASSEKGEKFNYVLSEVKKLWADKEESALRYLIETAVRLAKKNSQI